MTLREALLRKGIRFRNTYSDQQEIQICCLFCTERGETQDTRFRLGINVVTGVGHCFNCGWKSRYAVYSVLRNIGMLSDAELEDSLKPTVAATPAQLPRDFSVLTRTGTDLETMALNYLLRRGITRQQIVDKRIGTSFVGRYAYRIVFPVMESEKLQAVVARDFTGQQKPKYLNSPGEKCLYNLTVNAKHMILSEGVFKALRIEQLGLYSVATLGHHITPRQLQQLEKFHCQFVWIWPDPDNAGKRGAVAIADRLAEAGITVKVVWPVLHAADEVSLEKLRQTVENIRPYNWALRQQLISSII